MLPEKQSLHEQKQFFKCYKYVTNLTHFRREAFKAVKVTCKKQTSNGLEANFRQVTSTLLTGYKHASDRLQANPSQKGL